MVLSHQTGVRIPVPVPKIKNRGLTSAAALLLAVARTDKRFEMLRVTYTNAARELLVPFHRLQLAAALQRSGKPYELVIAAGARHVLDPFEAERDERAIRWFRRYLRDGPP